MTVIKSNKISYATCMQNFRNVAANEILLLLIPALLWELIMGHIIIMGLIMGHIIIMGLIMGHIS